MILTVGDKKPELVYYLKRGGRALDVSAAFRVRVIFTKPDGSTVTQTPTLTSASTGKITCPIVDGADVSIITAAGTWYVDVVIYWNDVDDIQHAEQPDVLTVREEGEVA